MRHGFRKNTEMLRAVCSSSLITACTAGESSLIGGGDLLLQKDDASDPHLPSKTEPGKRYCPANGQAKIDARQRRKAAAATKRGQPAPQKAALRTSALQVALNPASAV